MPQLKATEAQTATSDAKSADIVANFPNAIFSAMKNNPNNPLKGVISDPAFKEVMRIQSQAIQSAARVLIADLDVADGKADGILHKETLLKKAGKLASIFGLPEDVVKAKMKDLPETLEAANLNAGVAIVVSQIMNPEVVAPLNFPKAVQSQEQIKLPPR